MCIQTHYIASKAKNLQILPSNSVAVVEVGNDPKFFGW